MIYRSGEAMIEKTIYKVGGAGCGACILKIKNIVEPLAGVADARFDLKHNTLTVTGEHDENDVIAAMKTGKFTAEVMVR
jgi:copper chaperone CopZ